MCQVEPGELIAVVGVVGSGKSSLINAVIGEMVTMNGGVEYNGKVAYMAQTVLFHTNV